MTVTVFVRKATAILLRVSVNSGYMFKCFCKQHSVLVCLRAGLEIRDLWWFYQLVRVIKSCDYGRYSF